ncbi:MAG: T9SS type A sorting domain-containing protein [Draconibacterium sp.]
MKKFTGNFLRGGSRGALRILRSFALGLVALLWANSNVFAQTCEPPTGTVYFYADNLDACYDGDNLYTVTVSLKDFHNVDSLNLLLDYDEVYWKFESSKVLLSEFKSTASGPNGTNKPMTISDNSSTGVLNFKWTEWVTRGDIEESMGTKVAFAELTFSLKNFPNNSLPTYINNLSWLTGSKVLYCGGGVNFNVWSDVSYTNGKITTNILYNDVTVTIAPAVLDCPGDFAIVTVTSPVGTGYQYSFNGGTTWSTNPIGQAAAGDHVVWVKDANGCLSVKKYFTITVKDELTFTTSSEDESCANLGEITINKVGGTAPFTYWVVPEAVYLEGGTFDSKYSSTVTNQFLLPAGKYYAAVQDKCGVHGWKLDSIAPGALFTYDFPVTTDTVTCYNGSDGEVRIENLTGGYPWAAGYRIYIPGILDSMFVGGDMIISDLPVGTYEVIIADSVCSSAETFVIRNVAPITFYVDYTDAPCTEGTGTLWVNKINGVLIENSTVDYSTWTYRVVGGEVDTILPVGDTLVGLYSDYYSAWLIPGCPGDIPFDNVDGSGNTIPLLDDGSIEFDEVITSETCYEECDGTISVTNVIRNCENCNEGAVYEFRVIEGEGTTDWMDIDSVYEVCPGEYTIEVRDAADPDVCIVSKDVEVTGAESPLTAEVSEINPPTCVGGNDGWVKMYVSGGTAPYVYSVDNAPNWRANPSFGLTEGGHLLQVKDAQGCIWSDSIMVEYLDPIVIEATLMSTIECPGDKPYIGINILSYTHYSEVGDYTWYWSTTAPTNPWSGTAFVVDETGVSTAGFAAGTYYIGAKDPNGCISDIDTVVIEDVLPLQVFEPVVEDAECYGTWSGRITVTVTGGNPDPVYYYAYANNPDVFSNPNAVINWYPFTYGDTVESIEVLKGTYYIKVIDGCDQTNDPVKAVVDGYEPLEVAEVETTDVTCNGGKDGGLVITAAGGAPEAGVGKYLYTVKDEAGKVIGSKAQQASNTYTGLTAGTYMVYVYDETDPTAMPAQCPPDSMEVEILEPCELDFSTEITHVSCAGEENGIIYVSIWGGLGGNYDYTSNGDGCSESKTADVDGNSYEVTINQIKGEYGYSLKLGDGIDTVNFQTMGGDFEIVVKDANGCTAIDTVTVFEPKPWVIKPILEDPSDCNIKDGEVWAIVSGGFDEADIPGVEISVSLDDVYSGNISSGDTILLSDTAVYGVEYTITAVNDASTMQYLMLTDEQCVGTQNTTIEVFNPFTFDVAVQCVQCYGEDNGKVTISNIAGGSGKYQIQLVGGENPSYQATNEDLWWPKDAEGDNVYVNTSIVFDTLTVGKYWIYLRDDSGFTLANCCRPIEFTMCQPDTLELLTVTLVNNVECAGDSTGAISIQARGGEKPFKYWYSYTDKTTEGFKYPSEPADSLFVSDSIITGLPKGTYVGWVLDANGCKTGCEIDAQGFPIDEHRVVVQEAAAVAVDSVYIKEPLCYGGLADVELYGVTGGSGDSLTFVLSGKTYNGMDTTYTFGPWKVGLAKYLLEDVYASDTTGYIINVATDSDCKGGGDTIHVTQPPVFDVDATIISGAVCEGEDEVLVAISVIGGTAPFKYDIWQDGVKVRENSTIVNHVLAVGHEYIVVAKDAKGCDAKDTLNIETPLGIDFTMKNISCYGDVKASARITAAGTPGRSFRVWYKEVENDIPATPDYVAYNGWFTDSIDIRDTFIFDDENIDDVHYDVIIEDSEGCWSEVGIITFDKVQNPIEIFYTEVVANECTEDVKLNVTGGTTPYMVWVDSTLVTDMNVTLSAGTHDIIVVDGHFCEFETTYEVVPVVVVRDVQDTTFIGDSVLFVDAEAGVDTLLSAGTHTFDYVGETGCDRVLNVTVVAIPKPYTIAEVQGTGDESPIADKTAEITGTVTGIAAGEGFFVQDAVAEWSGIWVEYSDVNTSGIQIGNGVTVVGDVAELAGVTGIVATSVVIKAAPIAITPIAVTPTEAEAEAYESVLVKVEGARADEVNAGSGEWNIYLEVTDNVTVNDWMFAYTPVKDTYYDVTGIVNGRLDAFKVEPRMVSDIVDLGVTPVKPEQEITFNVYPNPFNDNITIENNDRLTRVVVVNIAGQRVIDIEYPNREIRTANLVSGVYVISLYTENGIAKSERIIKR